MIIRDDVGRDIGHNWAERAMAKNARRQQGGQLAPVRVFPKPDYSTGFAGVRSDFRDTVHWDPSVKTDKWGNAEVRFYLSDAITSFRPYRPARTPNEALRVLLQGVGTSYDPDLVRLFIQMTGEYPPGSLLLIDGGAIVMVTEFTDRARRGLIVRSASGEVLATPEPMDLAATTILSQVMADEAGVDPGSLLESMEHGERVER